MRHAEHTDVQTRSVPGYMNMNTPIVPTPKHLHKHTSRLAHVRRAQLAFTSRTFARRWCCSTARTPRPPQEAAEGLGPRPPCVLRTRSSYPLNKPRQFAALTGRLAMKAIYHKISFNKFKQQRTDDTVSTGDCMWIE